MIIGNVLSVFENYFCLFGINGAFENRTKLQWISAIQLAINNSGGRESYQRIQAARRRAQRDAGTLKIKEEALRRTSQKKEIEFTKKKLKQEIEVSFEKKKFFAFSTKESDKSVKLFFTILKSF